ncbi:MAG: hypothetical protein RLZZ316_520 [Bacteroidota bacterium]|jgi:hypothetical protein
MKKLFVIAALLISIGTFAAPVGVNEKVLKAFNSSFSNAEDIKWSEAENIYTVNFKQGLVRAVVRYDDEGNFLSSLRYYMATELPVDIICRVQARYPKRTATEVTEYTVGYTINYYINVEDTQSWITLKVDNDRNMEVHKKYKKQAGL